jgi:hypothetical protein
MNMLICGTADVLVFAYFHMFTRSACLWPERRAELQPVVLALRGAPYAEVLESPLFATVRLRPEFSGQANRSALLRAILGGIQYPINFGVGFQESRYVLSEGWHALEAHHVWSQASAKLVLPVPKDCETKVCDAVMKLLVFGASPQRPVSVVFDSADQGRQWTEKIVATSGDSIDVKVPLSGANGWRGLSISVPDATSPLTLSGSGDGRILGIALQSIEVACK